MAALTLLSGDARAFVEKVWASQVHVHSAEPAELTRLLSLDDVDHLLTSTALRAPALRLARDGTVLPQARFTRQASLAGQPLTGLVDARKVIDLFEDGATVVLQGLHRYWAPLTRLVRELELSLGHPCQANAYLTPPGSQGFAVHSDSHDVFVFQTHGTKMWEVHDETGVRAVRMETGTCMYLPTGTPHAARAQDSASLHVTVGINQLTWRHLLKHAVDDLLRDPEYDGHLPAGYPDDTAGLATELSHRLRTLAGEVDRLDPRTLADEAAQRFLTDRSTTLAGGLSDRLRLSGISDGTRLERRATATCVLVPDGGHLRVLLGDRELRMPSRVTDVMAFVRETTAFAPRDLEPWLDAESRLVLTRRLVREGLLRIAG